MNVSPFLPRAARDAHLPDYLDEFVFRFNRRRSGSRGLLFYRVLQLAVDHDPVRYRDLIAQPHPEQRPASPSGPRPSANPGTPTRRETWRDSD